PFDTLSLHDALPIYLSHHRLELTALGDQVSVTAVRAGDVVSVGERCAHTCRRGFLTNRHMHEAGHFALFEQVAQTFLELADRLQDRKSTRLNSSHVS